MTVKGRKMQNLVRLPTGGVVRIQPQLWDLIQQLCVELSNKFGRPVKESTVVMLLLAQSLDTFDSDKLAEYFEQY